jgi:hypothetical protein
MNSFQSRIGPIFVVALLLLAFCVSASQAQQATGTLRGTVTDELGGIIVGANITVTDASGAAKTAITNGEGVYLVSGLAPGKYTVRAESSGFAPYEETEVSVVAGRREPLNIQLKVTIAEEKVTVAGETPVSTEAQDNADQVVLRGKDLDSLPDDPDELAAALQALAGPSAGPNGGQIFIDGFTGGRIPPKASIREIRVNQNPFSAENDQPAGGRIDIFTKPGTDKFRGSASFNFNDESLNSRNPFSSNRPPFQFRQYGGNLSGPIIPKKASFFLDFERRETDDNEVVNAFILDPSLNVAQVQEGFLVPRRALTFSPRFDYQINDKHTLVARYSYNHFSTQNGGIGGFSLPERAFDSSNTQQIVQLTETAILSPTIINETRFQFTHQRSDQKGNNTVPTVNVLQSFTSGGSQVGLASNNDDRWELQNYTSWTMGHHALKAGGRLRGVHIKDVSPNNFGGTYVFAGGSAPFLDANNNPVLVPDPNNAGKFLVQLQPITSLDRYRRTLFLEGLKDAQGNPLFTQAQILERGGGPTQFSINLGNPEATVSQVDVGGFVQDDWRVRPNLTLSWGLRYEAQTNISSKFNFAPRLAFAWSPTGGNAARPPKTVIRGGGGIFYNRFGEGNTLQSNRFNGVNQLQFTATDAASLALIPFPTSAEPASLDASKFQGDASKQITWRVANDLHTPTFYMIGAQIEHQLPFKFTMFAGVFGLRIEHAIRARDINAPLPGTFVSSPDPNIARPGVRPFGNVGEIYQYESSGTFKQKQLFIGFNNRLNPAFSMFSSYVLSKTQSDTDGQGSGGLFPANSYDLTGEFGRAGQDVRHRFTLAGTLTLPWYKISLNPFIIATSGRPFNITTGRDTNGDKLFLERPAFAGADANCSDRTNFVCTRFGNFKLNPGPGDQIIPRNFGNGPGFFSVNMRVGKTWNFGDVHGSTKNAAASSSTPGASGGAGGGGRGREGGGGRGGGVGGPGGIPGFNPGRGGGQGGGGGLTGGGPEKRYSLTFSVNFMNLFNRNNRATPIGNLSSPLFGESTATGGGFGGFGPGGGGGSSSAGNRRIQAQVRFNF